MRGRRSLAAVIERDTGPDSWGGQNDYARVTFPEKPTREIITALKAAGFSWGGGTWFGKAAALPQIVADMADPIEGRHERSET